MEENIYACICRVCFSIEKRKNMTSLFDSSNASGLSVFGRYMKSFVSVLTEKKDYLPENICENCLEMLKTVLNFKQKCIRSVNIYKNILKMVADSNHLDKKIQEKIVEFSLYIQHFRKNGVNIKDNCDNHLELFPEDKIFETENTFDDSNHFEYDVIVESVNTENQQGLSDTSTDEATHFLDLMEKALQADFKRNHIQHKADSKIVRNILTTRPARNTIQNKMPIMAPKKLLERKHVYTKDDLTCKYCQKVLRTAITYRNHMQKHTGNYRYICEICGKGYTMRNVLDNHLITKHNMDSRIKCKFCDFKASRQFELKEHILIHTGERPWACEICGLTFRRRYIWQLHKIRHKERTEACPHCPRMFHRKDEVLEHINCMHERCYMYKCYECDVLYTKISTVRKHLTEKHGIPRNVQGAVKRIVKKNGMLPFPNH